LNDDDISNPITTATLDTWYYVTGTDANGCIDEDSVFVDVYALPGAPNVTYVSATHLLVTDSTTGVQWYHDGLPISPGGTSQFYTATENGEYWVVFTNHNGCVSPNSDTITIADIIDTTGVNQIIAEYGISVFPNPNNGVFNIQIENSNYSIATFQIIDITGKVILMDKIDEKRKYIDLSSISNGLYMLRINIDEQSGTYRIIKQ
jgi:hypothetical protein